MPRASGGRVSSAVHVIRSYSGDIMNPADALHAAQQAGLTLRSPAWIFGCLFFSLVGFAAWRYGKAVQSAAIRWLGVALMVYSYFTGPVWLLYGAGVALCVAIWWYRLRAH